MAPIKIHGATIDPEQPPEGSDLRDASNTNFVLVQTTHPLNRKEFAELEACGAQVLDLADANYTYRCRYEPHDLAKLETLDFVKHAIVYHQDFVLHGALKDVDPSNPPPSLNPVSSPDANDQFLCDVEIRLHEAIPASGDPLFKSLGEKLHQNFQTMGISSHANSLRVLLPIASLKDVAAIDQVKSITPALEVELATLKARQVLGSSSWVDGLYPWYASSRTAAAWNLRWDGSGETVAVVDSGFNVGIGSTDKKTEHPAFNGRIANTVNSQSITTEWTDSTGVKQSAVETQTLEDQDEVSHGTHVAGCIVGNRWNGSYNPGHSQNPESYDMQGTAPGAQVFVQKFKRPPNATPRTGIYSKSYPPYETLYAVARSSRNAVKIYNYSNAVIIGDAEKSANWQYAYSEDMDMFTFLVEENLVITAAGNKGDILTFADFADAQKPERWSNRQICSWSGSKNSLTIGGSWSIRVMDAYPHASGAAVGTLPRWDDSRTHEGDVNGMKLGKYGKCGREDVSAILSFSSKGPTLEGYLKPDLVAPGVGILSAFSLHPVAQAKKFGKTGRFSSTYEADYCYYKEMQFASGTSSATPLVSGIAACVRQAAVARGTRRLLAATVRAILVNTAVSLEGNVFFYWVSDPTSDDPKRITARESKLRSPPDCIQGFGLANTRRSLIPVLECPKLSIAPSDTTGYGWTGFHQVENKSDDSFTDSKQTWPRDKVLYSDNDPQTLSSCIYWDSADNKQLRVTLAYNDFIGESLKHILRLRVYQQIFENEEWTDVPNANWGPPDIQDYAEMDTWRTGAERLVKYGTVQKVTVTDITWASGQKMRFQMRVTAEAIFTSKVIPQVEQPKVGFSLCWLASKDAKF